MEQLDNLFGLGRLPKRHGNDGQPRREEERKTRGENRGEGGRQMERKGGGGEDERRQGGGGEKWRGVEDWNLRI